MRALRYYAEAAQAALLRPSPVECMNLTESALATGPITSPTSPSRHLDLTNDRVRAPSLR
jgi:hypothetical protein